ncbi:hypothetical protein AVEN_194673-1, partial [Araneus ventricosus]
MIEATPQHLLDCVALVYDDLLKRPEFMLEFKNRHNEVRSTSPLLHCNKTALDAWISWPLHSWNSASLSTISSALNSFSMVTVVDFIQPFFSTRLTEKTLLLIGKVL